MGPRRMELESHGQRLGYRAFRDGRVISFGIEEQHHLHQNPMRPTVNVDVSHDE